MNRIDFSKYWHAFLNWSGWHASAVFCAKLWRKTIHWTGWQKLFFLPMPVLLILCAVCAAGLVWVFAKGLEQWIPAYFLYVLSAYTLTAVCVKLPSAIRGAKTWLDRHPKIVQILENEELKFTMELYFEQFVNFAYGIFKIASGVIHGSAWIGADGIYNLTQALTQLFQILRRKTSGSALYQWRSYRFCGVLILLMHLSLTGIVFQMVNWGRAEDYPGYMIFATAAFAFYKIIHSFLDVAKDRKHAHPIDSSVRMLNLSQAIFSFYSLQVSLLHAFGNGESWEGLMNMGTGCVACLLVASMGVYMIRRGNREIRILQEINYG